MPKFVQEKFQVNIPGTPAEDTFDRWASSRSARVKKGTPGREGRPGGEAPAGAARARGEGGDPTSRFSDLTANYNSLPPGMDIEDQEMTDQRKFNKSVSGNYAEGHNAGDVTQDCTAKSIKSGFDRKECCPTDDAYTREHNDAFYDSPKVDGEEGFVERNNYLDRL